MGALFLAHPVSGEGEVPLVEVVFEHSLVPEPLILFVYASARARTYPGGGV